MDKSRGLGVTCPMCGVANPGALAFCGSCGSPLRGVCHHCGSANPESFRFCGSCGTDLTEFSETSSDRRDRAEYRQLTVHVLRPRVGSTALAERLDPEDLSRGDPRLPARRAPMRSASSAATSRSISAMACSSTSAIPWPTRTTRSEPSTRRAGDRAAHAELNERLDARARTSGSRSGSASTPDPSSPARWARAGRRSGWRSGRPPTSPRDCRCSPRPTPSSGRRDVAARPRLLRVRAARTAGRFAASPSPEGVPVLHDTGVLSRFEVAMVAGRLPPSGASGSTSVDPREVFARRGPRRGSQVVWIVGERRHRQVAPAPDASRAR